MKSFLRVLTIAALMFTSTAQAAYTVNPFVVCDASGDQMYPDIDGDIVVWQSSDTNIYWMQFGYSINVINSGGTQTYPAVSNGIVVWYDSHANGAVTERDIYGRNLQNGNDFFITPNDDKIQKYPDISGDRIVYEDTTSGKYNIWVYKISSGSSEAIEATSSSYQVRPAVDGDLVAWVDGRDDGFANYDIYWCDLSVEPFVTGAVSASDGDQWDPAISGRVIVWREDPGDGSGFNIYGYDLDDPGTGRFPICTASGNQQFPAISGNIVTWQDDADSNIWAIDLDDMGSGRFRVSDGTGTNQSPAVSGNAIVWQRDGDIWAAELQDYSDVEVTSPNGGESFTVGDPMTITWTRDGAVPAVLVEFSSNGGTDWIPLATVSDANDYLWDPIDYEEGSTDCRIQITNTRYPNVLDMSNGAFEVSRIPDEIAVLSPNGGEMVLAGSEMLITWGLVSGIAPVAVDIAFLNGGSDPNVIAEDIPFDDYQYLWTRVADVNSIDACRIRISDTSDADPTDASDAVFSIFRCDVALTADLTGDCFVDISDFAEMARQWLTCGNPYDEDWCFE